MPTESPLLDLIAFWIAVEGATQLAEMSLHHQAVVLIHECAHIRLGVGDRAYKFDALFTQLSSIQRMHNAESLARFYTSCCWDVLGTNMTVPARTL